MSTDRLIVTRSSMTTGAAEYRRYRHRHLAAAMKAHAEGADHEHTAQTLVDAGFSTSEASQSVARIERDLASRERLFRRNRAGSSALAIGQIGVGLTLAVLGLWFGLMTTSLPGLILIARGARRLIATSSQDFASFVLPDRPPTVGPSGSVRRSP